MADRVLSRPSVLLVALLVASAALVTISVSASQADATLPSADTIVLELGPDGNQVVYGPTVQPLNAGPSNCKLTAASVAGPILSITATSVDNKGNPIDPSPIGLVSDGLGTSPKGNGNGQDCGLVDVGESLTLALTTQVGPHLIKELSADLEGKFGGGAQVTYLLNGTSVGEDHLSLSGNGSDSGPDAREGDDYFFAVLPLPEVKGGDPANVGILFNAVRIEPDPTLSDPGSVSLKSGADFGVPGDNQTVFTLIAAYDCGDSLETGGPFQADDPLAHFFVGPTKVGGPCAVPIELTTTNTTSTGGEQTVLIQPPDGFSWDGIGVSGLLTVVWDVEPPDGNPIDRTKVRTPTGDEVIPWCLDVIGTAASGDGWSYVLDPMVRYDTATGGGDLCLVSQNTATVLFDDDNDPLTDDVVYTQTTEVFYLWNDPMLVRN